MAKQMKLMLAGYRKTRNGVVKKVSAPSPSDRLGAEVKKPTENIAHLIDMSVASKFDFDMANMTRTITQAIEAIDSTVQKFEAHHNRGLENSLAPHAGSLVQINTEYSGKKPMPPESSRLFNFSNHTYTPGRSASTAQQTYVPLNINQGGQNYASSSASNFVSHAAAPIISTSVPQIYNSKNRSGIFNSK